MTHHFTEALLGSFASSLLFLFPGLLLLLSYPEYPCQARDYKDSELKFEERVLGIADGLAEASRPLPKWPTGAQARSSGANAYLTLAFACSVPLSCQTHLSPSRPAFSLPSPNSQSEKSNH